MEFGETNPDIKQAKQLSNIFHVSIDELVGNEVKDPSIEKVSNTEKLATIIITILKGIGILFLIQLILVFIFVPIFSIKNSDQEIIGKYTFNCHLEEEEYLYEVEYNKNYQVITSGGDAWITDHIDVEKELDANQVKTHIEQYFKNHNGTCKITK